jgi:hypothetical protein
MITDEHGAAQLVERLGCSCTPSRRSGRDSTTPAKGEQRRDQRDARRVDGRAQQLIADAPAPVVGWR